jgi:hypothetical protein
VGVFECGWYAVEWSSRFVARVGFRGFAEGAFWVEGDDG